MSLLQRCPHFNRWVPFIQKYPRNWNRGGLFIQKYSRDWNIGTEISSFYGDILISKGWSRGVPLSSFQGVGIKVFHLI